MKNIHFKLYLKDIKKYGFLCIGIFFALFLSSCKSPEEKHPIVVEENNNEMDGSGLAANPSGIPDPTGTDTEVISSEVFSFLNANGTTLETRINAPKGYARIPSVSNEIAGFMRGLTLKDSGSEILLYDGLPKAYQDGHIAVFDLDIGDRDLQQCADSIMRIYAEYYWSIGAYDKIAFHLTNGFLMEYTKWRDGNRLVVNGNDVKWSKTKTFDDSYEAFRDYLDMVFIYAGTLSLSEECEAISTEDMRPGDMFLYGGSPGHCVLIVDVAEDKNGNRCFLLAQGYMPAQDFHVLKNPLHPEDPWYYTSELTYPLKTPSWTFEEGSLVRWNDFELNKANTPLSFSNATDTGNSTNASVTPAMSDAVVPASEQSSTVNLLAVGDNLIHIQVVQSGKQEDGTYNYDHLYANIKDEISAADIAIINQETILGGSDFAYSGYPAFNSPTEIGDAIIKAGFDVVLQATNHTMDMGYKGVANDLEFWKQHPEISVLGINETKEKSQEIPIIEKNGIKIAMLNYTYSLNGYKVPDDMPYLVNMLDKDKMAEDIKKAEELADFTIVFPHWGTEYQYVPNKSQEELAQFFYENGVDLVIGTHPHVLEPVEWIGEEGNHRMLIYYSLGNFMSYQKEAPRMLGGIANITITKDSTGTYISDAGVTPIVTHFVNDSSDYDYAIYKLTDYSEDLALNHGVSELAKDGPITYQETLDLAKQVLGTWFQ